ncbi:hypothetical protein EEB19_15475 [Gordonia sp. OPL2]|nr:hypothetical protein EEB19_15475 [Gordonia sp. OPL2]
MIDDVAYGGRIGVGTIGRILGTIGAILGTLGAILGTLGAILGTLGRILGPGSYTHLTLPTT